MVWKIEFDSDVEKDFKKLGKQAQQDILTFLKKRVVNYKLSELKKLSKPLRGKFSGLWRLRKGDYRIIYQLNDKTITICVIKIAHRKDIYR